MFGNIYGLSFLKTMGMLFAFGNGPHTYRRPPVPTETQERLVKVAGDKRARRNAKRLELARKGAIGIYHKPEPIQIATTTISDKTVVVEPKKPARKPRAKKLIDDIVA